MTTSPLAPRSTLGLGTGPIAGLFDAVSADVARATIDRAWEAGVRYFDTAPLYGSGLAEERLGTALAARPRDEYTISTKVGRVLGPGDPSPHFVDAPPLGAVFDYTPDGIRRSLAGSLERLGLERVDVVLLHDPEEHMDETRRAADAVRELAHWVGVGTNVAATAAELVARGEVDVVLLAGRQARVDIHEIPPAEIKKAVVGTGAATKEQVQFMLMRLLKLKSVPQPSDAADGVAAALACLMGVGAPTLSSHGARAVRS